MTNFDRFIDRTVPHGPSGVDGLNSFDVARLISAGSRGNNASGPRSRHAARPRLRPQHALKRLQSNSPAEAVPPPGPIVPKNLEAVDPVRRGIDAGRPAGDHLGNQLARDRSFGQPQMAVAEGVMHIGEVRRAADHR